MQTRNDHLASELWRAYWFWGDKWTDNVVDTVGADDRMCLYRLFILEENSSCVDILVLDADGAHSRICILIRDQAILWFRVLYFLDL